MSATVFTYKQYKVCVHTRHKAYHDGIELIIGNHTGGAIVRRHKRLVLIIGLVAACERK